MRNKWMFARRKRLFQGRFFGYVLALLCVAALSFMAGLHVGVNYADSISTHASLVTPTSVP
jgi:hypothetical protein